MPTRKMPRRMVITSDLLNSLYALDSLPVVRRVLRSGPATIVLFNDGTKSVVKRQKGEPDDPYQAVCAAIAKRVAGSGTRLKQLVESIEYLDEGDDKPQALKETAGLLNELFGKLFEGRDTWK